MKKLLIEIGYDKNGELDFGVVGTVATLSLKQMKDLREMIIVASYVAENMWQREQERKPENQASQESPKLK